MLFVLSVNHKGRIILDTVRHGGTIRHIEAEPEMEDGQVIRSAWQVARDEMPCYVFHHQYGHGYFLSRARE